MKKLLLSIALILPLAMNAQDPVPTVVLDTVSKALTLQDGDVVSGPLLQTWPINIAADATITLFNVDINSAGAETNSYNFPCLSCDGDATIKLRGDNVVRAYRSMHSAIWFKPDYTLTIEDDGSGTGSLTASSISNAAAIGGGGNYQYNKPADRSCGNIIINSGIITATGNNGGAGIGAGEKWSSGDKNYCGNITINGGTITAIGAGTNSGAGIGGGDSYGECGNITINGGTIIASSNNSAAIGVGGWDSDCGNILITGGNITATATNGTAIGGTSTLADCGNITITGGTVNASSSNGAGIGADQGSGSVGNITISGGTVIAISTGGGAGIGAGNNCGCGAIFINGGNVTASSSGSSAAIGGGANAGATCASITITEGVESLVATNTSQYNYNAIGNGGKNNCGPVTIYGQEVEAGKITNDVAFPLDLSDAANDNKASLTELIGIPFPQIIINRTLYKDGYFNTLCLPFDLTEEQIAASELAECELYSFGSAEYTGTTLKLGIVEETSIVAGKPYLIRWTTAGPDIAALNFSNVTIAASEGTEVAANGVKFVGTIGRTTLPKSENYLFLGAQDVLKWSASTDASSMKGFRAYFIVNGSAAPAQHAPARFVIIPKAPTAIENQMVNDNCQNGKWIKDGVLVIEKNGALYNAQGQIIK